METETIYYWPNNNWCYAEDLESHMREQGLSDDYTKKEIVVGFSEEEISILVTQENGLPV